MKYLFELYYKNFTTRLFCCKSKKEIEKFIKNEKLTETNILRIEKTFKNDQHEKIKTKIYNNKFYLVKIYYYKTNEKLNIKTGD